MGNTPSSNHKGFQPRHNSHNTHSSSSTTTTTTTVASPSTTLTPSSAAPDATQHKHRVHPSLRVKKRSLELPDLASLTLTPATSAHNSPHPPSRRLHPSDPIAIPARSGAPPPPPAGSPRTHNLPATTDAMNDVLAPLQPISDVGHTARGRPNPHMRGAPLQYNSTRSFGRSSNANDPQAQGNAAGQVLRPYTHRAPFVPEDVHSSIPLALRKAVDLPGAGHAVSGIDTTSPSKDKARDVCIVWRGAGKHVALMRAADDWKEKREMDYDESTKTFTTWISLMPGTHHIRFVVDGVIVCAEDLPTAVDDNGSLANYVAVPISGQTPPSASLHPETRSAEDAAAFAEGVDAVTLVVPTPMQPSTHVPLPPPTTYAPTGTLSSFLSPSPSPPVESWTSEPPWQIACAAEEEEMWLAHRQPDLHSPPAHPQAPKLPRHLEKVVLNARPPGAQRTHSGSQAGLATLVASRGSGSPGPPIARSIGSTLPVTTASGTNISSTPTMTRPSTLGVPLIPNTSPSSLLKLESQNLPDDGSVLPVPSHVVLQHLGTSAIKNGVLAVSSTNRYRKKYMTTIYYKPTST